MNTAQMNPDQATIFASVLEDVQYTLDRYHGQFTHEVTPRGIEVRVAPSAMVNPAAKLDYLRVYLDDETPVVAHFTHNGLERGDVRFTGAMRGLLVTVLAELVESVW